MMGATLVQKQIVRRHIPNLGSLRRDLSRLEDDLIAITKMETAAIKAMSQNFQLITAEEEKHRDNLMIELLKLGTLFEQEEAENIRVFADGLDAMKTAIEKARGEGLWRKIQFNLFETLGCMRDERTHSNILRWLLDPDETHGLGSTFLRALVRKVFGKELPEYLSVVKVGERQEGEDRPDIVVEGILKDRKWWLVIENKIEAKEGKGQTPKYAKIWGKKGKINEDVFLVFLSPSGTKAQSRRFKPVSYAMVVELLGELLQGNINVREDARLFLRSFIDHLNHDLEG